MKYKIWCMDRQQYFAEDSEFETLKDVEEQLKSYHSIDTEGIEKMPLWEICEAFNWEIHNLDGDCINAETGEEFRKFKCRVCGNKYYESFCSGDDVSKCKWCSGEEK